MSDTPENLERLLAERGARIARERARQVAELRAARVGPWAPAPTIRKPKRPARRSALYAVRARALEGRR